MARWSTSTDMNTRGQASLFEEAFTREYKTCRLRTEPETGGDKRAEGRRREREEQGVGGPA
jgi:hypothetical protein